MSRRLEGATGGAPFPKSATTQTDRRLPLLQADYIQCQFCVPAVTLGPAMQAGGNRRLSPEHPDDTGGLKRFLERIVPSWAF